MIEAGSDTWQVARVRLRAWVGDKPEELRRPWLTIVVGAPSGLVLKIDLEMEAPAPERVLAVLEQTMARPQVGPPGRPACVVCAQAELAAAIAPRLEASGIAVTVGETPELQQAAASLEEHLQGGRPPVPGLLETPGVIPEQVGRLFSAAATSYRAAPWRVLTDEDVLAVRFPVESARPRYLLVMGHGGIEYGLAVYRSLGRWP